jgi:hypothetical protein
MNTGENQQGLRQIIDFTRLISLVILLAHFYIYCHLAFREWGLAPALLHPLTQHLATLALFQGTLQAKAASLLLLAISLLGAKGRKEEHLRPATVVLCFVTGLPAFLLSSYLFSYPFPGSGQALGYMGTTACGYLLLLTGGTLLSRLLTLQLRQDVFNKRNESFPQEERLLQNEYSVNLPAQYLLAGKHRKSWINIINPFRALLVLGNPGSGKSYFIIRHIITQHIRKGFAMFLYDFKYDDLSRIAYNTLLRHTGKYAVPPAFYLINFDDLSRTHRCNPLDPATMTDITDATEASRTIMLGLNREWIKKQGDFFVESPINFVTAIIWFLKKYREGRYCTLPHVIELMQASYRELFAALQAEPEIEVLINPFVSAFEHEAMEQLEGQVASAKISMARLSSPSLYYVLSGNDFTLDLNNPRHPKVICLGNNPQRQQVYGAVLSLFVSKAVRLVNRKNGLKSSLVFDEFPTLYFNGIDSLIATARSNRVATTLAVQDYSQLKKEYGREQAEVILNIAGNIISGQASGETARQLSERFGKIIQQRESVSINSQDTSVSRSTQLDAAIPPAAIANLSSGDFVGVVADDPQCRIPRKVFHASILNNHRAIAREEKGYVPLPVVRQLDDDLVQENYHRIRREAEEILHEVRTRTHSSNSAQDP